MKKLLMFLIIINIVALSAMNRKSLNLQALIQNITTVNAKGWKKIKEQKSCLLNISGDPRLISFFIQELPTTTIVNAYNSKREVDKANYLYTKDSRVIPVVIEDALNKPAHYDLILCTELHWLKNHAELFQKIYTALKKEGHLFICGSSTIRSGNPFFQAASQTFKDPRWSTFNLSDILDKHYIALRSSNLAALLEKNHLTLLVEKNIIRDTAFKTDDNFDEWFKDWACTIPLLSEKLSKKEQKHLFNDILDKYHKQGPRTDKGYLLYKICTLTLLAQKQ